MSPMSSSESSFSNSNTSDKSQSTGLHPALTSLLGRGNEDAGANSTLRAAGGGSGAGGSGGAAGLRIADTGAVSAALLNGYVEPLLEGDRRLVRKIIDTALDNGLTAGQLLTDLVWPVMEKLQSDYKNDSITIVQLSLATRLNRFVSDYLGSMLEQVPLNGRSVLIFCGNDEPEELGGQITADLFQAAGYDVRFAGGGVPHDEVLHLIGDFRPDLLVMFATLPSSVPQVRQLIDYLREVNSNPEMQVMCCGGIYKRAAGLAEEIGADLYADDGAGAVEIASKFQGRRATVDQQTVGRSRRVRKAAQRRAPVLGRIAPRSETDYDDRAEAV